MRAKIESAADLIASELGLYDLAKYPFLPEAGEYVRNHGLSIEALARPDYQAVLERATQRVMEAARGKDPSEDVDEKDILSFALSIVLVKATKLDHLLSRFALTEALRVEKLLTKEKPWMIERIVEASTSIDVSQVNLEISGRLFEFNVAMSDYLKRAPKFSSDKWRLINQVVDGGFVFLTRHDLIRLFREEISKTIYERAKAVSVPRLPDMMQKIVSEIAQATPTPKRLESERGRKPEDYPPCVVHLLESQSKGENIPHFGRFFMATYLLTTGKTVDEVVEMHKTVPDFDERLARYQVEHIAGLRGGRTKYKVPTCRTVISHGMCYKHPIYCYNIKSPLQYPSKYSAKLLRGKRKSRSQG